MSRANVNPTTFVRIAGAVFCSLVAINALAYTSQVAIPTPIADSWYFIKTFVRAALEHRLEIADFFAQRGASDHAQPLQKLLLLLNLSLFDLDFRMETLAGNVMGVAMCAWLFWYVQRGATTKREVALATLAGCVVFAVGLSLNVPSPYNWPLVSYAWLGTASALGYALAMLPRRRFGWALVCALIATFVLGMIMDEYAILIFIATLMALLVRGRAKDFGNSVLPVLLGGVMAIFASRWLLTEFAHNPAVAKASAGSLKTLLEIAVRPDAWKLVVMPLSDSLAHSIQLQVLPLNLVLLQWAIAAVLLLGHLAFWHRALISNDRPRDGVLVVAVVLMLLFYAAIAGIAFSRVPKFSLDYFNQPRYVTSYRLNIIAMAIMLLAPGRAIAGVARDKVSEPASRFGWAIVAAAIGILMMQIPMTIKAWSGKVYLITYNQNSFKTLVAIGNDPEPKRTCDPMLTLCGWSPADRRETMRMLQEYRLSIYSPRFQSVYGLKPERSVDRIPTAQPVPAR